MKNKPKVDKPKTCKQHAYNMNTLNLCLACNCITKTIKSFCGKCGAEKPKTNKWEKILRALDVPLNAIYLNMEAGEAEDVHCETAKVVQQLITQTQQETLEWVEKYNELIFAVGNKYEGETRHQTALRYIKQAEDTSNQQPSQELRQTIKQRMEEHD